MSRVVDIEIRRARPHERGEVAEFYWRTWHETQAPLEPKEVAESRPLAFFEKRVAGWAEAPVVATRNGSMAGFAGFEDAYLGQVFVDSAQRQGGLGARLLAATEAAMAEAGHTVASLNCIVGNDAGRRFCERCGWTVDDEIDDPVTFEGRRITVRSWLMTKRLGSP